MDGFLFESHLFTISKEGSLCLVTHRSLKVAGYIRFANYAKSVSVEGGPAGL